MPGSSARWTTVRCRTCATCGPGSATATVPFYDPGQRYSLPYTVYVSGVAWRDDLVAVADAPDAAADPYGVFWNPRYRGLVGMYDGFLEAMSLALLRDGVRDVRAATDGQLDAATRALADAVATTGVRFTNDGVEEGLPEGEFAAHQAWSGDVLAAPHYAAAEGDAESRASPALLVAAGAGEDRRVRPDGGVRARSPPGPRSRVPEPSARHRRSPSRTSAGTATSRRSKA